MSGKLIALCGYKGSGKDTAADVLVEKFDIAPIGDVESDLAQLVGTSA